VEVFGLKTARGPGLVNTPRRSRRVSDAVGPLRIPPGTWIALTVWLVVVAGGLYLYFFQREVIEAQLRSAFSVSVVLGSVVYLVLGCIRGFTLIPSTSLVLAAMAFFRPVPLFILTLVGILVSSASIYRFAESLRLDDYFERTHPRHVARVKSLLQKHELPIIIGWSFFPLAPTDVICYVCGVLEVDFWKFLFGICIGEGTICGLYIFLGDVLLRTLHLR
jgi:uncharacterized membrane protein YdjX (TVP38/TMEM64 family)